MTLTFRWQFRVLGLQLQHMLNAQTPLITTISAIYFQAILSTCSIFHWVQSSWSPKLGSLSFLSWIFSDSHSHRRPESPDLATLTVWSWVVIPGQKRDLKWSRADEGQKLAQGRQRDGEGKQCGAAASRPQPALTHPVEEEEGCTSRTEEKYKQCL